MYMIFQAQKIANKLNRKRELIAKLRETGGFYRERNRYNGFDGVLTKRGQRLIDEAFYLIESLQNITDDLDDPTWDWYCDTYNDGCCFDAFDLAA